MLGLPGIEGGDHIEFDCAVRDTGRPAADSGRWGSTSRRWRRVWTVEETYCSEKSRSRLGSAGSRLSMAWMVRTTLAWAAPADVKTEP